MVDVAESQDDGFLALARELSALMARKEYGRIDVVRDESSPLRFYLVRQWASTPNPQEDVPTRVRYSSPSMMRKSRSPALLNTLSAAW